MAGILLILLLTPILGYIIYANFRTGKTRFFEYVLIAISTFSLMAFGAGYSMSSAEYYTAIDIVDDGYTPFASHLL